MTTYINSTQKISIVKKYFCLIVVVGVLHEKILTIKCSWITVVQVSLLDCVDGYYLTHDLKLFLSIVMSSNW